MKNILKLIYITTFVLTLDSTWAHIPAEPIEKALCDQACRVERAERIERIINGRDGKPADLKINSPSLGAENLEGKEFKIIKRTGPDNTPDISIYLDNKHLKSIPDRTFLTPNGDKELIRYTYSSNHGDHLLYLVITKGASGQKDTFFFQMEHIGAYSELIPKHLNHVSGSGSRN
ncbi:MAG: hypothetical protein ABJJ44_03145 [Paraglaciecola sp.]|uniref:hypothetical protein n=1 Tax=Paraglaciecola sp. TaxID=1920173 RepID=UPI0032967F65